MKTTQKSKFQPRLEALEARWTPSCTATQNGTMLTVHGDKFANTVVIEDDVTAGTVTVTCDNGVPKVFNQPISILHLYMGKGDDNVMYNLTGGVPSGRAKLVTANLSSGNDTFHAKIRGRVAGTLSVTANGASGNDNESIDARGTPISAGAVADFILRGYNGDDTLNFDYGGVLNGTLSILGIGADGNDTIQTGDVLLKDGSNGAMSGTFRGNSENDTLTMLVHEETATDSPSIDARITGNDGVDIGNRTANVKSFCETNNLVS